MTVALRSLFRFLHQRGDTATNLAESVPAVASWSLARLPRYLSPQQIEHILQAACKHTGPVAQRDRTILLLLARLGLRAGEIVHMTLDDIDWDAGELTVHGKGGREDKLPLPKDVGESLARYLQRERPQCACRSVFIRSRAPHRGFAESSAICFIVQDTLRRAGIKAVTGGAHLFRHALATRMLRNGASLPEIGEILRHQLPKTTAIYAKVDIAGLRVLAQPWLGGSGMVASCRRLLRNTSPCGRALGFKLEKEERLLENFVKFLQRQGATYITCDLAVRWAMNSLHGQPEWWASRLAAVRGFAKHRAGVDSRTEIPAPGLLPHRHRRKSPYVYSEDEIRKLIGVARQLHSPRGLRGTTFSTLFGLLAVAGLRISECLNLDRSDLDLAQGILQIRHSKFGKS